MRQHGGTPATIAILGGVPHIGLTGAELELLASRCRPSHPALPYPDATMALSACCIHELQSLVHMTCHGPQADVKSAFEFDLVDTEPRCCQQCIL